MQKRDAHGRFMKGSMPWNKGKPMSEKSRRKESETKKRLYMLGITKNPRKGVKLGNEIKRKISISRKLVYEKHPEIALRHSDFMKKYWRNNPEKLEQHKKLLVELWKNPKRKEKASRIGKEVYRNHPELRQASRERFIKWLIENKDALRYIEQSKGNKHSLKKTTKKGEKVRSFYEVMVANWLYANKIRYFYEGKMLVFPDYKKLGIAFAVPDFFLPDYNAVIEVYGDYPGTRSKTIKKNKAYKFYGIPCLGLTPSGIKNLGYEISGFLEEIGKNPELNKQARSIMWGMLD